MYLPNVGDTFNYKKITIKMHYTKPLPQDHYERLGLKTNNNYKGDSDCSEVWAANDDGSFTCVWCRPYHLPSTMVMRYFNKYKGHKKSPGYTFSYKLVMPKVTLKFRGKGRGRFPSKAPGQILYVRANGCTETILCPYYHRSYQTEFRLPRLTRYMF